MKHFIQTAFTKIKDYFTANSGRKIFFFGLVAAALFLLLNLFTDSVLANYAMLLALTVACAGTMWDSMQTRYYFLKKIRDLQYEHIKEIYDKQEAGEGVEFTPTFSDEEKRFLRRRKWWFILVILFKLGVVIALFSLLLIR